MNYPDDFINKIICGDCLEVMKDIPDKSVDLVVTSPPYNFNGFNRDGRVINYLDYKDNLKTSDYKKWIENILVESSRVLKIGGVLYWNHKGKYENYKYSPPHWVIDLCPLNLFQEIIWKYPSSPDVAKVKWYPRFENIYMFSKGKLDYFNPDMAKIGNVWEINHSMGKINHPAPYPLGLAKRCVESVTKENNIVLDPFIGSGTTAVACKSLGRKYIGIEISPEYCDIARKRVNVTPEPLFV